MNGFPTCSHCGKELIEGARFCPWCGSEKVEAPQEAVATEEVCLECGAELQEEQLFCHVCGQKRPKKKNGTIKNKVLGWIRHSLVLAVAILFVAVAFLPITHYEIEMLDEDYDIRFSAIDNIVFCFDAMKSLDSEELLETNLYEKLENLEEDAFSQNEPESADVVRVIKLAARLALQSEEIVFSPQYAVSALLSLLYLLFAVAFFVISALNFLFYCIGREKEKLLRAAKVMLAAIPPLALVAGFASLVCLEGMLTGTLIALVSVAVAVLAYLCIEYYFLSGEKKKVSAGAIVKRSLSTVACALLLFSALLPMARFDVKAAFGGSTKQTWESRSLDISFFENLALNETQLDLYDSEDPLGLEEMASIYSSLSKKEFRKGDAETVDAEILVGAFSTAGAYRVAGLISLIPLLALLASLAGAVLLWQNFVALISNASPHKAVTIPVKVLGALAAALMLALVIVFVAITDYNLHETDFINAKLSVVISAGVIFHTLFAAFAASVPMGKRRTKQVFFEKD